MSENNPISIRVKVQLSPPFWGWLFQFGKLMKVTVPKEVAEEYRDKVRDVLEQEP